jgi:surface-anchored protein
VWLLDFLKVFHMNIRVLFSRFRSVSIQWMCLWGVLLAPLRVEGGLLYVDGHGDIGVSYIPVDGANPSGPKILYPHWHLGDGGGVTVLGLSNVSDQEFAPSEITAVVPLTSKFTNPDGPAWSFLGAAPAANVYFLSQNNPPNTVIPFLGIASEDLEISDWTGLTWNITTPSNAPGSFSLFTNGVLGPSVWYSSNSGPSSFPVNIGSHDHFNFAFTQSGFYDLEFKVTGTHAADGFKTASGVFQFFVGDISAIPEPNSMVLLGTVFLLGVRSRRRLIALPNN